MKAVITTIVLAIFVVAATKLSYADDIRIFCNEEPPTNFSGADGTVTGFTTEIVREIQKRVGNSSHIKIYPWKRAYKMALKEPNIVLFTASRNPDREDKFHWISQVTTRRSVLWSKVDSPLEISSMEDARRVKSIGVLRGGNREKYLRMRGFTNLEPATEEGQNLKKLLAGRIDLVFLSTIEAATLASMNGISFNEIEPKFTVYSNDSYILMSKNGTSAATVKMWKDAAQQIKVDGTFKEIGEKWVKYIHDTFDVETEVKDNILFFWKD